MISTIIKEINMLMIGVLVGISVLTLDIIPSLIAILDLIIYVHIYYE